MRLRLAMFIAYVALTVVPMAGQEDALAQRTPRQPGSVLDFRVKDIDGKEVSLARYRGKVILIVNVASQCGLTPQYSALQALYEKHRRRGFVILAFPANNFANQEPGTNSEIKKFCSTRYRVTFPVFAKISVKGEDQAPLYRFLTSKATNPEFGGEIEWNFAKFILGRDGRVAARFAPRTSPDDPALVSTLEKLLAEKP